MGRLVAVALVAATAMIVTIAVNGAGKDKPKKDARTPERSSAQVASGSAGESTEAVGEAQGTPTVTVRMRRLRFKPATITVAPGAIVRFVNRDNVDHTVVADVGARSGIASAFQSLRIHPGGSFQIKAGRAGDVEPYVCTLHPSVMKGFIYVRSS